MSNSKYLSYRFTVWHFFFHKLYDSFWKLRARGVSHSDKEREEFYAIEQDIFALQRRVEAFIAPQLGRWMVADLKSGAK